MDIYLVLKEGIYIQCVYGIFNDFDLAMIAAKEAKALEPDDYHQFFICERILNENGYEDYKKTEVK